MSSAIPIARTLVVPFGLLLLAQHAVPLLQELAATHGTLLTVLPYLAAALPLSTALLLQRSRAVYLAIWLALGGWGLTLARAYATSEPLLSAVLFHACGILLPLNFALCGYLPEYRSASLRGLLLLGLIPLQLALLGWLLWSGRTDLLLPLNRLQLPAAVPGLRLPGAVVLAFLFALALLAARFWRQPSPFNAGLLMVLLALAVACNRAAAPAVPEAFVAAASLILAVALVLHTHHIAYRDELTGLPSRRALNEYLANLGRRYTIAMLDVDHFKQFNDTYGHDVGDQVLRMVASHLRRVGGGGKAFRYGGEEFTIVFAGKEAEQVRPQLEELREAIAAYPLVLRGTDRPTDGRAGRRRRGQGQRRHTAHVTISIGMASRSRELRDPAAVIKAADEALYRAKRAGRNRLAT
ncbi:MAG: GGDEF domain-containing protein [Xanthomonadaceae bacterium]|nr:GGDEF domain-containing protein [Xanthomonadaceae bacterium]